MIRRLLLEKACPEFTIIADHGSREKSKPLARAPDQDRSYQAPITEKLALARTNLLECNRFGALPSSVPLHDHSECTSHRRLA